MGVESDIEDGHELFDLALLGVETFPHLQGPADVSDARAATTSIPIRTTISAGSTYLTLMCRKRTGRPFRMTQRWEALRKSMHQRTEAKGQRVKEANPPFPLSSAPGPWQNAQ